MFISRRRVCRGIRDGKSKIAWTVFALLVMYIAIDNFGVVEVIFEKDFQTEFSYPLNVKDFQKLVNQFRHGEKVEYTPINTNFSVVDFIEEANTNCNEKHPIGLLLLVKSAPSYFKKRLAIRETWGDPAYLRNISESIKHDSPLFNYLKNYSEKISNDKHMNFEKVKFSIKLVFLVGKISSVEPNINFDKESLEAFQESKSTNKNLIPNKDKKSQNSAKNNNNYNKKLDFVPALEKTLSNEILKYNDIIRADFIDSYENNTFKTMIGLRWAVETCSNFKFAFLVDDDMYLSVKNLVKFMESPKLYPEQFDKRADENYYSEHLYAGKVLSVRPVRYKIGTKWYLSLQEYPFNEFPKYMPAAAILMSKSVVEDFYYASFFTKNFRFDDIYLGLLAHKMNITPFNSDYFHVCHTTDGNCDSGHGMKYVIARHGLTGPNELKTLWSSRKTSKGLDYI